MSFFPKMLSGLPVVYFNSALEYLCLNFKDSFALKRNPLDHPCAAATDRGSLLFWEPQLGTLLLRTPTQLGLQDRGSSWWKVFWMGVFCVEGLLGWRVFWDGGLLGRGSSRMVSFGWRVRWATSLALLYHRGCRKKALIWGHR